MYRLILTRDKTKLEEFVFDQGTVTLGRSTDNDVQIKDDTVSGTHAKIIAFFRPTFIQDWNSTNGTFVNGNRIKEHTLKNGDVISIGRHKLIYDCEVAGSSKSEPEQTVTLSAEELKELHE